MKRLLVILLGALLLALAIVASAAVFLARSEAGTRLLAAQVERFVPIRFTDISGTLWGAVRVGRVEFDMEGRVLAIKNLAAALEMMPLLFDNRLILDSVAADDVTLTDTGGGPEPGQAPALELPFMPIEIDVAALAIGRLELPGVFPMAVQASAAWLSRGLVVRSLSVDSDVLNGRLEGELGTGSNPRVAARVSWSLSGTEWAGEGSLSGRVNRLELDHRLRGQVSGVARGTADLSNPAAPVVELDATLEDFQLGDTTVGEVTGRLNGTLENVSLDTRARVAIPGLEPFRLEVGAYGPVTGPLALRNVAADALGGTQQAQGSLDWREGLRLTLGGTAENVALSQLRDEVTGRMNAAFQLLYDKDLLRLGLQDLSGTINDRQIDGELAVVQVPDGWILDPLRLHLGDNEFVGSVSLRGPEIDVDATVAAPGLGALGLGVDGDAAGTVRLTGRWPNLNGSVDLRSARLEGYGVSLQGADIAADLKEGVLRGTVTAAKAQRGQLLLSTARLTAQGALNDVAWSVAWADGEGSGSLRQQEGGFLVQLATARVHAFDQDWRLDNATQVTLVGERISIAPACITGGGSAACVEAFEYSAGQIETRGELKHAPVALLEPWLPVRLGDAGYLEGRWALAGTPGDWRGELTAAARQLAYVAHPEEEAIALPDVEASGTIAAQTLTLKLAATDEAFTLAGEGSLAPIEAAGALTGSLTASASDLAPLKVFDQRIESLSGSLGGRLELSGTLTSPKAQGQFEVTGGQLVLNNPDLALDGIDVLLRLDDSGAFELRGTAAQRGNELLLSGSGSGLLDGALAFDAALKGKDIRAEHPDWEVDVSPDLTMTYANGRGRVRGRVEVPMANVRLKTLPTSVPSPSADVVVVGRDGSNGGSPNTIRVDVELVLGDDVHLKALGISADLEGTLKARLDAQGRTTLRGTLAITGGVLSAQGQTLSIESGSVVYNGPATKPYIDVRAVRMIEDAKPPIKVGLHIRGNADSLTSSVFSEPPMAETRALAFLVLGRDIDTATTGSDSGQLLAAAINLGLSQSKGLTRELRRMTGLDELSAMAEAQNSFAIVAGKRISDDLYVRYTYNTLSAVGAFLVRYDLTRRWHLEAQSSEDSAMDLMYSFEK